MRLFVSAAAIALPVCNALGQQPTTPAQQPEEPVYTLHSAAREVNLDVVVTDRAGHPVKGLKRDDFRIFDQGKPQALLGFTDHSSSVVPVAAEFKLPPNTFTNYAPAGNPNVSFVILFDSLDSSIDVQMRAFAEATDFLKDLVPGTSVALFDLNQRMNLVQGFTTDKAVLLNALKDRRAQPQSSALLGQGNELWRQQILNDGMTMLGRYLSGFPGRKNLIWFVVNIPGSLNSRTASIHAGAPPGALAGAEQATDSGPAAAPLTAQTVVEQVAGVGQQGQTGAGSPASGQSGQATALSQNANVSGPQPLSTGNQSNGQPNGVSSQDPSQSLTNLIDDTKSTSDVLTLSRVVVYPVDPRQLMTPFELAANPDYRFEQAAMQDVAEATGGEAFVNRNGIKSIMQEIVSKGSDFYTLNYLPANTKWDGTFRKLKVETVRGGARTDQLDGLRLQYRPGYYATDRLAGNKALAGGHAGTSSGDFQLASEIKGDVGTGRLLPVTQKASLQASMTIGQIPPTELILSASVKPSANPIKLVKGAPMPDGDYMRNKFKHQPYRMYDVLFATDTRGLQLPQSTDGLHHGGVEFVAVVYTDQGDVVNSFKVSIALNLKEDSYRALIRNGMGTKRSIAIPVKGNYVVRLGVHDLNSDRVGALEFPLSSVNMGVAGVGQQGTP